MNMSCHWFLPILLISFTCSNVLSQTNSNLELVNSRTAPIAPGSVYLISNNGTKARKLFTMLETDSDFHSSIPLKGGRSVQIGINEVFSQTHPKYYMGINIELDKETVSKLEDPIDCIQILNRPFTKIDYNRDAEIKIATWKSSLEAILKDLESGDRLGLCTEITYGESAKIVFDDLTISEEMAKQNLEKLVGKTDISIDMASQKFNHEGKFEAAVKGRILVKAEFLPLQSSFESKRLNFFGGRTFETLVDFQQPHSCVFPVFESPSASFPVVPTPTVVEKLSVERGRTLCPGLHSGVVQLQNNALKR